jgi:hypothetical protein
MDILYIIQALLYIVLLVLAIAQIAQQLSGQQWQPFSKLANRPRGKVSHSYRTDPHNRQLQTDLLVLLKGDVATAKRLLKQQRQKHPGRSDNWYLEKVIHDLERDRH